VVLHLGARGNAAGLNSAPPLDELLGEHHEVDFLSPFAMDH